MDTIRSLLEVLPSYIQPLGMTVAVTVFGAVFAVFIAFVLGLGAGSHFLLVRGAARTVIEFFRGTSLVVQLFWFAVVIPFVFEVRFDYAIVIGILTLGMNYGAYGAEVVRGSIAAVAPGQHEACVALNLSFWQKMRLVIVPQAWPEMIPPLSTLAILLLKGSALISMAAEFNDLTFHAQTMGGRPEQDLVLHLGIILVFYFILAYLIATGMRFLERRAKRGIGRDPAAESKADVAAKKRAAAAVVGGGA